jgi:hypothetical protein
VNKENNLKLKVERDSLLVGIVSYKGECDEHHGNGKEHHEGLKIERLAVLAEAITG